MPNEKRDLSTSASRSLGHWEDSEKIQYYFGPLDSNTKKRSLIFVIPDSRKLFEEWIALYRNARHAIGWSEGIDKKLDVTYFSERYGEATFYWQYVVGYTGVNSQGNTHIDIRLIPDFHNSAGGDFVIDKNGKTMKLDIGLTTVEGLSAGPWLFGDGTLKYIDSKISPEDIATSISPEKRNLSTPHTRLVGHWKAYQGSHLCFSPVDLSTMIGAFIHVYPEFTKEMFEKFKTKLNHVKDLSNRKREKLIKIYSEIAKQYSSLAVYCKYQIYTQKRNGERIGIDITCENSDVMSRYEIFHINKNGKFMTDYERPVFEFFSELLEEQEIDKQDIIRYLVLPAQTPYEKNERRFIYIDSNTSPEDKK
jgi:hypothetical protein